MSIKFKLLIQRLEETSAKPADGAINLPQCDVETEIIGYLVGCKLAKHDPTYTPEDLSSYPLLPLAKLNHLASKAATVLSHN